MDIVHLVDIKTKPNDLFDALTTQRGLSSWWASRAHATPKVGAVNEFPFGPDMNFKMKVDELTPGKHVKWSSTQGPPDWNGTKVTFDIEPKDGGVMLRFKHSGFASTEGGYGVYNYSWAQFLRSLKNLLETGKGEPAP